MTSFLEKPITLKSLMEWDIVVWVGDETKMHIDAEERLLEYFNYEPKEMAKEMVRLLKRIEILNVRKD